MKISHFSNPEENQRDGINFTVPCFETTHRQIRRDLPQSMFSMNTHTCKHHSTEKAMQHRVHYHISPFHRLSILTLITEVLQTCRINYYNAHTSITNDGNLH